MPTAYPQVALDRLAKVADLSGYLWFAELIADQTTDLTVYIRLCNDSVANEFPTGTGVMWDPVAMRPPTIRQDSDGTIPRVDLTIMDPRGELMPWFWRGDGFSGRDVTLYAVNRALLASTGNAHVIRSKVADIAANDTSITLQLGDTTLMSLPFPRRRYQRLRCDHGAFTGPECLFPLPVSGQPGYGDPNIMNCDKTLDGPAGCRVHGDNEVARGLPRLHPLQYGGCPSIPVGPRR